MGLCLLAGLGAAGAFAVLTAAGFVLMACAALFTVTMLAHIQSQTPAELVGKVVSLLLTVSLCAQPLGQALYGVLLERLAGQEGWVLLGAACGAAAVALAARRAAQMLRPSGVRRKMGGLHRAPESRMRLQGSPVPGWMAWA